VTTDDAGLAGTPDGFERLWTPHRMVYIDENSAAGERPCPFCTIPQGEDEAGLIVHRGAECFVVMNLYPYNPGHLLVCPYRHVADYTDLTLRETAEVASLTQRAMAVIRTVSAPAGFNLGMNQGSVAGAGIAPHLHQHVVPRWLGDANFMPIIGRSCSVTPVPASRPPGRSDGCSTSSATSGPR
jgi:ATP adenylyltransferase